MDVIPSIQNYQRPLANGSPSDKINKLKQLGLDNELFNNGVYELEFVINNLKKLKIDSKNYDIDLTIARGLDYYTGTVYETILKDFPSLGSVCSGGRYDDLASYYTDKKLPGVGISIGLTRLFYQLKEEELIKNIKNSIAAVAVLPLTNNYEFVYDISNRLRKNKVKVDIVYLNKLKQLIKYADRKNIPYVIIIGDDEISKNVVLLKKLSTGQQFELNIDNLYENYEKVKNK